MGFGVRTESAGPGRPLELLGLSVVLSATCFPLHRTSSALCLCIFQEPAGNTRWVSRMWKLQEVLPHGCYLACTSKLLLKHSCLSRPSCPWSFLLSKAWGINKRPGSPWLWAMTLAFTSFMTLGEVITFETWNDSGIHLFSWFVGKNTIMVYENFYLQTDM